MAPAPRVSVPAHPDWAEAPDLTPGFVDFSAPPPEPSPPEPAPVEGDEDDLAALMQSGLPVDAAAPSAPAGPGMPGSTPPAPAPMTSGTWKAVSIEIDPAESTEFELGPTPEPEPEPVRDPPAAEPIEPLRADPRPRVDAGAEQVRALLAEARTPVPDESAERVIRYERIDVSEVRPGTPEAEARAVERARRVKRPEPRRRPPPRPRKPADPKAVWAAEQHPQSRAVRARQRAAVSDIGADVDDLETSLLAAMASSAMKGVPDQSAEEAITASVDELASSLAAAMESIERTPDPGDALLSEYEARIGDLDRAPTQARDPNSVNWRHREREAYEIIQLVNGKRTFRRIMRRSGLKEVHAAYLLAMLLEEELIR